MADKIESDFNEFLKNEKSDKKEKKIIVRIYFLFLDYLYR